MKRWLALSLASFLVFAAPSTASDVAKDCLSDLNYLPLFLLKNDAGARDHLARVGGGELSHAFARAKTRAQAASTETACNVAIAGYLEAWRSGHLMVQPINTETGDRSIAVGDTERDYEPMIRFLSPDTALLEVNSFHPSAGQRLQRELMKKREELSSRKNWIIDVRQNQGGSDSAYQPLLPWLLVDDIVEVQLAFLATDDNIDASQEVCALYAPGDQSCVEFMKPVIERMRDAKPGTFVGIEDHEIEFIQIPDSPYKQPERVAVLMGEDCVSSCEQFLLTARQSFAVKLIGRSSKGNLDYSNLRPHMLPSGKRQLLYATSKSFRLPSMPVDVAGVMPDIYLPKPGSVDEWKAEVSRVQNWLEGGSLAPVDLVGEN
ncbi:hypothetical protein F6455_04820 [Proteobacteria bacterium 005FR1]|nr:hypothetical protein [Proteobacteria bacterium 005FR1]